MFIIPLSPELSTILCTIRRYYSQPLCKPPPGYPVSAYLTDIFLRHPFICSLSHSCGISPPPRNLPHLPADNAESCRTGSVRQLPSIFFCLLFPRTPGQPDPPACHLAARPGLMPRCLLQGFCLLLCLRPLRPGHLFSGNPFDRILCGLFFGLF